MATAGLALSFPFFALYLHKQRGVPMGGVGLYLAFSVLLTAFSHGLGGELSDTIGRRRVMVAAQSLKAVFIGLIAWAVASGWPLAALLSLHLGASFVGDFYRPASRAWVADHYDSAARLKAFSYLYIAINVGWAIGPAVGGILAAKSYAAAFAVTAAATALSAAVLAMFIHDGRPAARAGESFSFTGFLRASHDFRFTRYCFCLLLLAVVSAQMVVPLSVHSVRYVGLTEAQVGALFSLNGVVVILLQPLVTRHLGRARITTALMAGSLLYACAYALVGWSAAYAHLLILMTFITVAEVVVTPGIMALSVNMAPARMSGRYAGFADFSWQLGTAAGPLSGGLGLQYLSPRWPALTWIIVAAAGLAAAAGFGALRPSLSAAEEGLEPSPMPPPMAKEAAAGSA